MSEYKYNAHVCVSGIPAYENMIKCQLNDMASAMPLTEKGEGKFWNTHMNGYWDSCPGIVMLGNGDICALDFLCSLNPLTKRIGQVNLSSWSSGGIFTKSDTDWGKSIKMFNDGLSEFSGSTAILGYIIFAEDKIDNDKTEDQWVDHIDLPDDNNWVDHIDLPDDMEIKDDNIPEIGHDQF